MIFTTRHGAPAIIFFASLLGVSATQTTFAATAALDHETVSNMVVGEEEGVVRPALVKQLQGEVEDDPVVRSKFGLRNVDIDYFNDWKVGKKVAVDGTVVGASPLGERKYNNTRIIGGREAKKGEYSFTVALQDDIELFCGGSLIAKDVVLTAAHCFGPSADVAIGRHDLREKDGEVIPMKKQMPHPKYDEDSTNNDFMLVFLKTATKQDVDLVMLNDDASEPDVGETATVLGWGDTDIRDDVSTMSDVLMEVDVKVISNDNCDSSSHKDEDYNGQITKNMLCAKANLQDSCQNDSGGPLVQQKATGMMQIGVVSWGVGCASPHFPGVYARVNKAYKWIKKEVCNGSQYASEAGFDCDDKDNSNQNSDSNDSVNCNDFRDKRNCKNEPECYWERRRRRCRNRSASYKIGALASSSSFQVTEATPLKHASV